MTYPASISVHEGETIRKTVEDSLVGQVIEALTGPLQESSSKTSVIGPKEREIIFRGTFDEINELFHKKGWSDGLPIVPPTIARVEQFLKYTDRRPEEIIGTGLPLEASIWKIAVNGVMAGCRPEYMPILIAVAEVMADPGYGLMDSGSTPGWEAILILNGPIRDQLDFNYKVAVQRPGNQANTSIGRFYRLIARNLAGFLPGSTDMATFGHMFRAVVPENDQAVHEIGWKTLSEQRGFSPEDNVVTIASARAISETIQTSGERATQHLEYLTDWAKRMIEPYQSAKQYIETHILLLTPVVAQQLAKDGFSKDDVSAWIKEHMTVTADYYEQGVRWFYNRPYSLLKAVEEGTMPKAWAESEDPHRMVPLLLPESRILIVVTGHATRARSTFYRQNFNQGYATSKKVQLPANWNQLISELGNRNKSDETNK